MSDSIRACNGCGKRRQVNPGRDEKNLCRSCAQRQTQPAKQRYSDAELRYHGRWVRSRGILVPTLPEGD